MNRRDFLKAVVASGCFLGAGGTLLPCILTGLSTLCLGPGLHLQEEAQRGGLDPWFVPLNRAAGGRNDQSGPRQRRTAIAALCARPCA